MASLTTSISAKQITYTATVKYTTFNTLLDPCAFLQSDLGEDIVKDLGLSSGSVTSCTLISVSQLSSQKLYIWEVTVIEG